VGRPAAVGAAAHSSAIPVEVRARGLGRYAPNVEAAAYFTCLEAVQNAVKHSGAATVRVDLRGGPGTLVLTVEDDGRGFDPASTVPGAGLANIRDRVESVGGTLHRESTPGHGTRVRAVLPATLLVPAAGGG
jgi:signal transduction histidine kinase